MYKYIYKSMLPEPPPVIHPPNFYSDEAHILRVRGDPPGIRGVIEGPLIES